MREAISPAAGWAASLLVVDGACALHPAQILAPPEDASHPVPSSAETMRSSSGHSRHCGQFDQ
jgi:hypothetical protein